MPWNPDEYLRVPPRAAKLNENLNYLKETTDQLAGATAPVGTIAILESSGAGAGYVIKGPYEKRPDGTWLWRPDLHGGLLQEANVSPSGLVWTVQDGLQRVITKANWEFVLTGSGTHSIVLGTRWQNSATIAGRTVSELVYYGFRIPSGMTINFVADTNITLRRADGTTVSQFSQAGPARTIFLHGAGVWEER